MTSAISEQGTSIDMLLQFSNLRMGAGMQSLLFRHGLKYSPLCK